MVWLIGNKGMLGSEVETQLEFNEINFIATDREVDITNLGALEAYVAANPNITWIVNCAAYTAVEKAEEEPELAEKLNATGAGNIATVANKIGARMIHISTDYVFDGTGKTPYTEIMPISPLGVYGRTKADGEKLVQKNLEDAYIFRTAWLYGPRGKNFVYTMVNLMNSKDSISVVNDQFGSPTCTLDLARYIIMTILGYQEVFGNPHRCLPPGIYHCTGEGKTTWYDFALEIYRIGKEKGIITKECQIKPCSTQEYGARVQRPAYSVLSKAKLKRALDLQIPTWQESLRAFMASPMFKQMPN
ncbi:MAG: dTDP-4-dehydrorhamnose reductase [Spirochaetaceae bacterium]|nr:dTDP-4-dehydrorhamnose reductase [Spirochaetaceae bacterium]